LSISLSRISARQREAQYNPCGRIFAGLAKFSTLPKAEKIQLFSASHVTISSVLTAISRAFGRFAPLPGFVTLRQTFVRRSHGITPAGIAASSKG
jgi:hypothetical protein